MALFMLVALSESETFNFDGHSIYGTVIKDILEFEIVFNAYTSKTQFGMNPNKSSDENIGT